MHGASNIAFVVLAAIGAFLAVIPFPKALASRNVGTSVLITCTAISCLLQLANAVRWNGNVENWAPGWCDFCAHFLIAADVALVASGVSINRRIYMIVTLHPRAHEKVFNNVVDCVVCLALPCVSVALEYVVQQYRFRIYEDVGCIPGVGAVSLALPLVWMIPLVLGIVSAAYACLTVQVNLRRNRRMFAVPTNSAWSWRLMAIGAVSTLYGLVPMSIILFAAIRTAKPWPGWRVVHSTIDVIVYVPAQEWQSSPILAAGVEMRRWIVVTLAFIIFGLLGLTTDVRRMYRVPVRSQTYSDQTCNRSVLPKGTDEELNEQKDSRSSHFNRVVNFAHLDEMYAERRPEGFGSTDGLGPDLGGESIQLILPAATHTPIYSPWKPHFERNSLPMYTT